MLALVAYAFLVVGHGWTATPLVGLDLYGSNWEPGTVGFFARISGLLLTLLVGGAVLLVRLPRLGAALVTAGALGTPIAFLWGAPVLGPTGIAVTAAAIVLARRRRRTIHARASSATS